MANKKKFELYRVLYTESNLNLIDQIFDYYASQEEISSAVKTRLTVATNNVNLEKLKEVAETAKDEHLIYVGVCDGKIVSTFTHMYKPVSKEIYLYECNTHESVQNNGYGTKFYTEIAEDIFKTFGVFDICADAVTDGGRKLLEKLGFLPNTKPFSFGGNAILYSPLIEHPKLYIRLETLMDVCPTRDFTNSPNIDKYNQVLKTLIYNKTYVEAEALQFFKQVHTSYMKANAPKTLKKISVAQPVVPPPVTTTDFMLGGKVYKFSASPSFDLNVPGLEDFDPAESEIEAHLRQLEKIKNLGKK